MSGFPYNEQSTYQQVITPSSYLTPMTPLGEYFTRKSINRAIIARKAGLSKSRLSELCNNTTAQLRVRELYQIAVAMDIVPSELLEWVCRDLSAKRKNRKHAFDLSGSLAEEPYLTPRRRRSRKALPKIARSPKKPSHPGIGKRQKTRKFR